MEAERSRNNQLPSIRQQTHNRRGGTQTKTYSRKRVDALAAPRQSMRIYTTSFPNPITWGNQTAINPISSGALQAEPTVRLESLSQPKKDFLNHELLADEYDVGSCGRESSIWYVSEPAKNAVASGRTEALAQHRTEMSLHLENKPREMHEVGSCGRVSPVWDVTKGAQRCEDRERTAYLAKPKAAHRDYQAPRTDHCVISDAAKKANCSARVEQLAQAKAYDTGPFREPEWVVSGEARRATASERVQQLSEPKKTAKGYRPCRGPIWQVHLPPMDGMSSKRVEELSIPIQRETMDHVQFNPDAFTVSRNALKAKPSARIEELAQPIERK